MAEFVAFDPRAEVCGQILVTWSLGTQHKIDEFLFNYGVESIDAEAWYPIQTALNALRDFGKVFQLFNAGMLIPDYVAFPPDIIDVASALNMLDAAYHMNHRNGEIGHYFAKPISARAFDVVAENPYPCEFDFGLIHNLVHRVMPPDIDIQVVHDRRAPCRRNGQDSCTYHISW